MIYKFRRIDSGVPYLIQPGKSIIGRSSEADIQIDDESISRKHAQIENNGVILFLRDLNSTNGTFVADQFIEAPTMIEIGSIVQVGEIRFRIDPESEQAEPKAPVVSWQSYQRATNKMEKMQFKAPLLKSEQPSEIPQKLAAPMIVKASQPQAKQPVSISNLSTKTNQAASPTKPASNSPIPWKLLTGLAFGTGIAIGIVLGLALARLL